MAIGANSYGSVAEVAAMTARYLIGGTFTTATRPTLAQVEKFIDNASSTLNVMLAKAGFSIPITQADAKAACAEIVIECVVDMCHAANSTGRFFTDRALERGLNPMKAIREDIASWVEAQAPGLEALGASRSTSQLDGIAFRGTDDAGNEVFPIFQRDGFSNVFDNWSGS